MFLSHMNVDDGIQDKMRVRLLGLLFTPLVRILFLPASASVGFTVKVFVVSDSPNRLHCGEQKSRTFGPRGKSA